MSEIANYWKLPLKEQERIIVNNPITKCTVCGKEDIRLLSCDACGESACFACAIPCGTLGITPTGLVDADDIVLCKNCGVF
jgi:hypothetical protein